MWKAVGLLRPVWTAFGATVYFDPKVHRALRLKAAATDRSVSELVNEAVGLALGEDAADSKAAPWPDLS